MFDHYVQAQAGNPRWRRAVSISAIASGVVTAALLVALWVSNKMSIRRVDPPTNTVMIVQLMTDDVTPAPPPPPPPKGGQSAAEEEPEPEPDEPDELPEEPVELEQPQEVPDKIDDKPKTKVLPTTKGIPGDHPQGVPWGDAKYGVPGGTGIPGVPGVPGGLGMAAGVRTKREPKDKDAVVKKPIEAVRANGLYTPECDAKKLSGTTAATFDRRPGSTKISFCIDEKGRVDSANTVQRFRGDPQVDKICLDTVKKWRFNPFKVAGKPVKTCSSVEFRIVFE